MARYVDGFVIPIKKSNVKLYKKMALVGKKVWIDHGALDYYECIGDELNSPTASGFPKMAKLKSGETAIFAFIVYKSKAHRNSVNKKVMKDPRMSQENWSKMPFDMKRFASGGFSVIVQS